MKRLTDVILLLSVCLAYCGCTESVSANICSAGGVNSAVDSLPSGGIVDLTACGSMNLDGPLAFGTPTAPVTLKLGTGTITFTNTSGHGFVIGGSGSRLIGQGANSTIITTAAGFSGDIIHVEPAEGQTLLNGIEVAELEVDQSNAPAVIGLNVLSVRDPSSFHNLALWNMTGTAIQITTSPLAGGRLPQGIGLHDIYVQTKGSLSGDTVVVTGNQIYLGPNVKIVTMGAPTGPYRGLVIKPTPTSKGDGRYNTFFSGAVAGYTTCVSIEAPAVGPGSTGAIGNVIGPGNTFENCSLAYEMTGADSSHPAGRNWGLGNSFENAGSVARLDFALDNFVQEISNGNPGAVTLTPNSVSNTVFLRQGDPGDVLNMGSKNLIYSLLSNAAYIDGDLHVSGTLYKAAGSFRIDHPLDPQNKYLQHSFVESPDMMDIYNGVVTLGEFGTAEVQLPDYFEALNRDFRYQLTPIGAFAPLYVAREMHNRTFTIAGGRPKLRVSWQVTGIRHDAYAQSHRIEVEVDKFSEQVPKRRGSLH